MHAVVFRVLDFFKKQKVRGYDRQSVLGVLPFELKSKILRHLYAGAIHSVQLLQKMADDDVFLTDMCIRLQPYNCSANTFVYQRGEGPQHFTTCLNCPDPQYVTTACKACIAIQRSHNYMVCNCFVNSYL